MTVTATAGFINDGGSVLRERSGADRAVVEAYIKEGFRAAYGADLQSLMPRLFTLSSSEAGLLCAFGLRAAADSRLYMEQYLDLPVEEIISRHENCPVARSQVIEVGNLVSSPGGARAAIISLTRYLHRAGYRWVVFTGIATLRAAFMQLGLCPFVLAAADPARLDPSDLAAWGRYFVAHPQVMAGDIAAGFRALAAASMKQK